MKCLTKEGEKARLDTFLLVLFSIISRKSALYPGKGKTDPIKRTVNPTLRAKR